MTRSALVAATYLVLSIGSVLIVALTLSKRWERRDTLVRAVYATLLAIAQMVGVPLVLGMAGALSRTPVLIVHLVLAGLVYGFWRPEAAGDRPPAALSLPGIGALAGGAFVAAAAAIPALHGRVTVAYDSREYHIATIVSWLQRRSIWPLPYQNTAIYRATYPGNGEMLGLWLTLPTHSDQLSYLMPIPFWVLGILSLALLVREMGGDAKLGALAGVALTCAPVFIGEAWTLSTDMAAAATFACAIALLVRATRLEIDADKLLAVGLAGVALGLSVGAKYTALVAGAVVLIWAIIALRPRRALWTLIPGLLLFAGPWFVRNAIRTGNPLFPEGVSIGGVHVLQAGTSPFDYLKTTLAEQIRKHDWRVLRAWGRIAARTFAFVGLLAIGGVLASPRRHPMRRVRLAVAGLAVVAFVAYVGTPYSGTVQAGFNTTLLEVDQRYALIAVILGAAVGVAALPSVASWALVLAGLAYGAWRVLSRSPFRPDLHLGIKATVAVVLLALVVALAGWVWPRLVAATPKVLARAAAIGVAMAVLLGVWGVLLHVNKIDRARNLEHILDRYRSLGTIEIVDIADLRSVFGSKLQTRISALAAGTRGRSIPFTDAAAMNVALEATHARVLLVPLQLQPPYVPAGWAPPPHWHLAASDQGIAVYIKA